MPVFLFKLAVSTLVDIVIPGQRIAENVDEPVRYLSRTHDAVAQIPGDPALDGLNPSGGQLGLRLPFVDRSHYPVAISRSHARESSRSAGRASGLSQGTDKYALPLLLALSPDLVEVVPPCPGWPLDGEGPSLLLSRSGWHLSLLCR